MRRTAIEPCMFREKGVNVVNIFEIIRRTVVTRWIFDVEIEKLRAQIFFEHVRPKKTKIMLGADEKF
jgi:hypothetical protein